MREDLSLTRILIVLCDYQILNANKATQRANIEVC